MVQAVVSLSCLSLGVFTVVDWLRHQELSRGYLALALATLGLTSVLGQLNALTGYRVPAVGGLTLVLFMVSGYSLLLFRDSFIPLSRRLRVGALVLTVTATAIALVVTLPSDPHQQPTAPQSVATIVVVLVWSACVIEPIVRFWMASRRRPAVQRARLRAIAGGYGAIVLILLVAGFSGTAASNPVVRWLFEGVALVAVPLLYVSFAAPRWLRRLWRQGEEDEYRDAVHDLVLFSPDRPTLARRASEWGLRLVGAEGIAIVDANGEILALRGLTRETAHRLAAQVDPKGQPSLLATQGSRRDDAIVVPLPLDLGLGAMVVVSGPYTPFFGTDEVSRLRGYAANLTAALDRARVTERLAALENAIKYSPNGGRIQGVVSTADRVAILRVVDDGVGIAPEDLPRLFNRFERIEHRETSQVGGTGLGLYLSRELARQHGGDIHVESRPPSGSTFTLTLPVVSAPADVSQPIQIEPEPAAPRLHVVGTDADADSESQLA